MSGQEAGASEPLPKLSVVLVVGNRRWRAEQTLTHVLQHTDRQACEIIVADSAGDQHTPLVGSDQPSVRTLRIKGGQHIGDLRFSALRTARAEIVAFLEDHVALHDGFIPAMLSAFGDGYDVVGPMVQNANLDIGVSNAVHFLHYGLWDPSIRDSTTNLLPGNNSAYRKSVLAPYGDRLARLLLAETVLLMRLGEDQSRLFIEPSARIDHLNATSIRTAVYSEYLYQRCFVVARGKEFSWSRAERFWILARTPLAPWIRIARLAKRSLGWEPTWRRRFVLALPAIVALQIAAAWGQITGLVIGRGTAPTQFTEFELSYSRPSVKD